MNQQIKTKGLPKNLQKYWNELDRVVVETHAFWLVYRQLFAEKDHYNFLQQVADVCFTMIHESLLRFVLLRLSALTDGAKSRDNVKKKKVPNFSLRNFQAEVKPKLSDESSLDAKISKLEDSCKKIKHKRNKILAHIDRMGILRGNQHHPSRKEVETCLKELRSVMEELADQLGTECGGYEMSQIVGDGNDLMSKLRGTVRTFDA
jgi:hypothetical protein